MKKYNVHVTLDSYDEKPDREEIMNIQRTIGVSKRELTKELLAHMLVNGHAVTTGILKAGIYRNGGQNVVGNEVLMLDFDNDGREAYTIEDVKNHNWIKENAAFLYETYSSTKERPRFRAVIFLKERIAGEDVKQTYKYIFDRLEDFPMDTQAQNPDRLFFGSKSGQYIEVNMDNEWEAKQKPEPVRRKIEDYTPLTGTDTISYDDGLDIITAYVDLRSGDLQDQNHWLDAMYTLHGAYVNEQITEQQALDYAEALADGDGEWAEGNITRMETMIDSGEVREVLTFRDKFQKYIRYNDEDNDYKEIRDDFDKRKAKHVRAKADPENPFIGSNSAFTWHQGENIIKAYVEISGDHLKDTDNMTVALRTLQNSVKNKEIGEDQALNYALLLADGNKDIEYSTSKQLVDLINEDETFDVKGFGETFLEYVVWNDYDNKYANLRAIYLRGLASDHDEEAVAKIRHELGEKLKIDSLKEDNKYINTTEQPKVDSDGREVKQEQYPHGIAVYRYADTDEIHSVDWGGLDMYGKQKPFDIIADIAAEVTRANLTHDGIYIREPNKKYWTNGEKALDRYIAGHISRLLRRDNEEIKHQIGVSPVTTNIAEHTNRVQLRNGYHLNNGELIEGSTDSFTPWYLHADYNPEAYDEHVDDFLNRISGTALDEDGNKVVDSEMRLLFEEMIGHILLRNGKDGKMFFLADTKQQGETGKSTLGEMLTHFVNGTTFNSVESADDESSGEAVPEMGGNIQLTEFNDNTIASTMTGKMLNFGDETTMDYLKDTSTIKTLVTQDYIEVRIVYAKRTTRVKSTATFIFATNGMPDIADKSGGIVRRIMIVPFDHKIIETGVEPDLNFGQKLTTDNAKSYLLNLGLKGIASMKANKGRVHVPEKVRLANEQYLESNDPVLQYINEKLSDNDNPFIKVDGKDLSETDHREVYNDFKEWSETNGIVMRKRSTFEAQMMMYGYDLKRSSKVIKTIDGGRGRPKVYVYNAKEEGRSDLIDEFIKKYKFENVYWVDAFNDYIDYVEEHGGEEITRSTFNSAVLARGYVKKKASKAIDYGRGKYGRPMTYAIDADNPFLDADGNAITGK